MDSNPINYTVKYIENLMQGHLYKLQTTDAYFSIPLERCVYFMDNSIN